MPNRLAAEKSPYLLQHADNPVDWYPWGDEPLKKAQAEDKPMLVSIGYSACHWCHVMEHESFEDANVARLMNENFVNIKVDREERPDVDTIYMEAVQALTGQGGWPLNVFLTPDGRPFYGGTYFPPNPRHGMPSWVQVLENVAMVYRERKGDVLQNAAAITDYIRQMQQLRQSTDMLTPDVLRAAFGYARGQFDWREGGFGGAPKFPQPLSLEWVLRMYCRLEDERARTFVELTLQKMASGGLFDQLGGGFHRYAVDGAWVVPHFEKMLYDNALLARVYLQAFQLTHGPFYRAIVEQTLDYLLRDMRSPEGGFFSAQDADSEGVEGKFYVWTPEELEQVLGREEATLAALRYGVRPEGNFEGRTILTQAAPISEIAERLGAAPEQVVRALARARDALLAARAERVPPGTDTKILVSWNALAVRALAEAGRVLSRADYLGAAERAAAFLLDGLRPHGRLVRSYKDGPSDIPAYLEDYSFLLEALLTLYETTFVSRYLQQAQELADEMVQSFWEDGQGALFDVAAGEQTLIVRPRNIFDNPIPSGNSAATFGLLRLEALTGESIYSRWALPAFRTARDLMTRAPLGVSYLLSALDFYLSPPTQIAVVGDPADAETRDMVNAIYDRYLPNKVVAVGWGEDVPLLAGRSRLADRTTAYVCEHFACKLPVTDVDGLSRQLDDLGSESAAP